MSAQIANAQNIAANPKASSFLTANAGSGKTSTLVNRVARLLLNGARPERILCVTYTKAAAAEMQDRLFSRLGDWAIKPDNQLADDLAGIDEAVHDLPRARALFAKALETPGGLKIQTLHGFCEKLLRRFPLEAELSPAFQVLDDLVGARLAQGAIDDLLTLNEADHPIVTEARDRLIRKLKVSHFEKLLTQFIHQHDAIADSFTSLISNNTDWRAALYEGLGLDRICTPDEVVADFATTVNWADFANLAKGLSADKSKTNKDAGKVFEALYVAHIEGAPLDFKKLKSVFITNNETPRENTYTKETSPDNVQRMERLKPEVSALNDRHKAAIIAENSVDALFLFHKFSELYQAAKRTEGALDFQDLINKTKALLSDRLRAMWVLYKLDEGLEHILVDEAQDTSADQWTIVKALAGEFFTGEGQAEALRTIFAVGDEKQSIYGFQGAQPDIFIAEGRHFDKLINAAGQTYVAPDLIESWRTLPEILTFVDQVFPAPDLSYALNFSANTISHVPRRLKHRGLVELWPLVQSIAMPEQSAEETDEVAPVDAPPKDPAPKRLAQQIATTIKSEIAAGRTVYDKGKDGEVARPLHAGDVLILVRKRDALFEHIIRELKMAGVPVSGADRLKLDEHIAFQDVRALMRFCLQPNDDLSLACVLRSPLCDLSETDLYELSRRGDKVPLWRSLRDHPEAEGRFAEARALLVWAHDLSGRLTAFDFLGRVLNRRDGRGRSLKQRFLTRLGNECEDVLDETLALALKGEGVGAIGLSACLDLFEFQARTIKREQEEGGRTVRVMTVHGSKGLEAPWVILPIGPQHTSSKNDDLMIRSDTGELYLCAGGKAAATDKISAMRAAKALKDEQEGLRLLYVGLTRARDRLTLCGFSGLKGVKTVNFAPWYDLLADGFDRLPYTTETMALKAPFDDAEQTESAVIKLFGERSPLMGAEAANAEPAILMPDFATRLVAQADIDAERGRERWAAISQMGDEDREDDERAPSPLETQNGLGRYRRGELIHKLFEILPDIATDKRSEVAERYLARQGDLPAAQRLEMAAAVMTVLNDARFAEAFGPQSRPEVALAGRIGTGADGRPLMLSGRIDRLVVTPDRVVIIDYKSNRPAPDRAEDAAIAYQRQMAGYVALLRQIHPGKTVEAALLWTDGPRLTPLTEALVNLRLAEVLSR
ncbi:MAG: double-strand break repair helicase AddA [Asticcacaulis sp.]